MSISFVSQKPGLNPFGETCLPFGEAAGFVFGDTAGFDFGDAAAFL